MNKHVSFFHAKAHPLCTTSEFAILIKRDPEFVRCKIRAGLIEGNGRPKLINVREALKFGLTIDDAYKLLTLIRTPAAA